MRKVTTEESIRCAIALLSQPVQRTHTGGKVADILRADARAARLELERALEQMSGEPSETQEDRERIRSALARGVSQVVL